MSDRRFMPTSYGMLRVNVTEKVAVYVWAKAWFRSAPAEILRQGPPSGILGSDCLPPRENDT
jgi:hypothetical protein